MRVIHWVIPVFLASLPAFSQAPAERPEFEVASIRPSGPTPPQQLGIGLHIDGAQVTCTYLSLKDYIGMAYRLKLYQISGPDWIGTERFDIAAKLPAGAPREQVPAMLQALLEDRFKIKLHRETKEFPVYALIVGKGGPKMKETPPDAGADSTAAPGAVNVSASGGRGGVSINLGAGSSFTFANNKLEGRKLTMPRFADTLARFMDRPVVDMTQLPGVYDFTLDITPEDFMAMQIRAAITAGVVLPPQALAMLEGVSGDSFFAAVQTLGLKLDSRKAPLEVVVIDKAEKAPTEN
ncbi:MAG TPA: TIGR03435 family protein [Bryobacteraceae bacterium]|jgi:uncharacterized protein (TIGR03435 family)